MVSHLGTCGAPIFSPTSSPRFTLTLGDVYCINYSMNTKEKKIYRNIRFPPLSHSWGEDVAGVRYLTVRHREVDVCVCVVVPRCIFQSVLWMCVCKKKKKKTELKRGPK